MSECAPSQPKEPSLGIDARTAREMKGRILGEIPFKTRTDLPKVDTDDWTNCDYVRYGKWLSELLGIDPAGDGLKRLTWEHVENADALRIGPRPTGMSTENTVGLSALNESLGQEPHQKFLLVTNDRCVRDGKVWADAVGRRPTRTDMEEWSANGYLPSWRTLDRRFADVGGLNGYFEEIGRPKPFRWGKGDFVDYGSAYKRQMGLGECTRITGPMLDSMCKQGRGPSESVTHETISLFELDRLAEEQAIEQAQFEKQEAARQRAAVEEMCASDPHFAKLMMMTEENDRLRVAAQHRLIRKLLPEMQDGVHMKFADAKTTDTFVRRVIVRNPAITVADIENRIVQMGLSSAIWGFTYRFQNVDFSMAA